MLGKSPMLGNVAQKAALLSSLGESLQSIGSESVLVEAELAEVALAIEKLEGAAPAEKIPTEKLEETQTSFNEDVKKANKLFGSFKILERREEEGSEEKIIRLVEIISALFKKTDAIKDKLDSLLEKLHILNDPGNEEEEEKKIDFKTLAKEILFIIQELKTLLRKVKDDVVYIKVFMESDGSFCDKLKNCCQIC